MKKILIVVFIISFFGSCSEKTGIPYNDSIIYPQKDMVANLDSIINFSGDDFTAVEKYRKQLIEEAKRGLSNTESLKDFRGNIGFRDSGLEYFNYAIQFFENTPDIDSMLFKVKSNEAFRVSDSSKIEETKKGLERFVELESILLEEQQKFLKEFNVQTYQIPAKTE